MPEKACCGSTAGSVDDGKSTDAAALHDSKGVYETNSRRCAGRSNRSSGRWTSR